MDWVSAGKGSAYVEKSADGYYAIAKTSGYYMPFFIESLWAQPEKLGVEESQDMARSICEQHASKR